MKRYTVDWNPGVREFLERIGAQADVIEFIESQDDPKVQGKLANEVRKQPGITLDQIAKVAGAQPKKREPNDGERNVLMALGALQPEGRASGQPLIKWVYTPFGEWALVQLMKHRHQPQTREKWLDLPGDPGDVFDIEETEHLFLRLRDWSNYVHPRLASFSLIQAFGASEEWHRAIAGKETGKVYDNTGEIIHEWDDGWTVRTVTSPNDLDVEGPAMQHCVATYKGAVSSGRSRIFSLRDPNNMPHVTIELRGKTDEVVQIQGKQDKRPIKEYRERVAEWLQAMGAFRIAHNGMGGENDITYKVWEQYDIKDAAYAIGDYYNQKDADPYGEDEEYGIPLVEEIEWSEPDSVLEAVVDKYDQNFKSAHDPKNSHAAYHLRRIEDLNDEFVERLSGLLLHQCEKGELDIHQCAHGEIDENHTVDQINHRKKKLFEEAAKLYYGLYQIDDETGYWIESDWTDAYFAERGIEERELGTYEQLPEDYLSWANKQVLTNPMLALCRAIIEKLEYTVFPVDTTIRDAPGQGMLFSEE